jgi:hypothetical protein
MTVPCSDLELHHQSPDPARLTGRVDQWANQTGHTVDVSPNVYTQASVDRRLEAVNGGEKAVTVK